MARSAEEQHRINRMIVKKVRQSGRGEQSKAGKAKDNAGTVGTARVGTAKTGKGTAKAGKGTAKAGTANLARLQVASKMAKAGRKQDGPEIKAKNSGGSRAMLLGGARTVGGGGVQARRREAPSSKCDQGSAKRLPRELRQGSGGAKIGLLES